MSQWFSASIRLLEWTDDTGKQMYWHSHSRTPFLANALALCKPRATQNQGWENGQVDNFAMTLS